MSLTYTPTDVSQVWDTGAGNFTVDIGAPSSDRIVVISFQGVSSSDSFLSPLAININGIAAPIAVSEIGDTNSSILIGIAYLPVPTGTTASVAISVPFAVAFIVAAGIITGDAAAVLGPVASNPLASSSDPQSISAAVPSGGVAVIVADTFNTVIPAWTNATGDLAVYAGGTPSYDTFIAAHGTNSSPSFTGSDGLAQLMAMATFGPSGGGSPAKRSSNLSTMGVG